MQDEAIIKSMSCLPFVVGSVSGITQVRDVGALPQIIASNIEGFLSIGHYVYLRALQHEPARWSLDGLRHGLGLQSVGVVNVSGEYPSFPRPLKRNAQISVDQRARKTEERTVAQFLEGCEANTWAVIEHPIHDPSLPKFTQQVP